LVPLDHGTGDDAFTQASCYQRLARQLQEAVRRALQLGSKRLLGAYLQALLSSPYAYTRKERVVAPLSSERRQPLLQALLAEAHQQTRAADGLVLTTGTWGNLR